MAFRPVIVLRIRWVITVLLRLAMLVLALVALGLLLAQVITVILTTGRLSALAFIGPWLIPASMILSLALAEKLALPWIAPMPRRGCPQCQYPRPPGAAICPECGLNYQDYAAAVGSRRPGARTPQDREP